MPILSWLLVIVLAAALAGVGAHNLWRSRGGTSLAALGAGGAAGMAVFTAGMSILAAVTYLPAVT